MTDEQTILDGERVRLFLEDSAVVAAFARLDAEYYAAFKKATTPEQLALMHAKSAVLDDLKLQLAVVIDAGKMKQNDYTRRTSRSVK